MQVTRKNRAQLGRAGRAPLVASTWLLFFAFWPFFLLPFAYCGDPVLIVGGGKDNKIMGGKNAHAVRQCVA